MKASFWHDKWETNQIGFHESDTNPLLLKHIDKLALAAGDRLFLPLCGKTRDIAWLLSKGYRVAGAELSDIAVKQLFDELGVTPVVSTITSSITYYQAENLDLFVGDIFDLTAPILGDINAIFDRAALVALPPETRVRYASHLVTITANAPQLLICFEYDQSVMNGPPFSIVPSEVKQHYDAHYTLSLLDTPKLNGGLKGKTEAIQAVWLLQAMDYST